MSLINDALKRANEVQPPTPPPAEAGPPLRPAEHKPRAAWPIVVFPAVALFVLALAGWFLVKGYYAAQQLSENRVPVSARESANQATSSNQPTAILIPTSNTVNNQTSRSASERPMTSNSGPSEVIVDTKPTNAESVVTEPPPPTFKLQGIFYRPSRPSAMVNSKTVFVGDKVGQAKVLAIGRDSVTLQSEGETKVLTLP